jgi:hypothetical protein
VSGGDRVVGRAGVYDERSIPTIKIEILKDVRW